MTFCDKLQELETPALFKMIERFRIPWTCGKYICCESCKRCSSGQDLRKRIVEDILNKNTKNDLLIFFKLKIEPIVKNRNITATYTDVMQIIGFSIEKFRELQNLDINNSNFFRFFVEKNIYMCYALLKNINGFCK